MKKIIKALIILMLLISMVASVSSCGVHLSRFFKKKNSYTGGFSGEGVHYYRKIHWVETFEEMMIAVEHLKAAGNEIPFHVLPNYENDVVDAKYCFFLSVKDAEKLKDGEKWYDRKGVGAISIVYFGFLDKVSIEELEYSYTYRYRNLRTHQRHKCPEVPEGAELYYACNESDGRCCVKLRSNDSVLLWIEYDKMEDHMAELPADYEEEFPKSIVIIE